jgi:hypothetical protein
MDRDAIGSLVELEAGGRVRRRLVQPAYSYCASNDPRVHFGLGPTATVDRLRVVWPDGREQVLEQVAANQILRVEAAPPGD